MSSSAGNSATGGTGSGGSTSTIVGATSSSSSSSTHPLGPQVWLLKLPAFVAEQFKRSTLQAAAAASSASSDKAAAASAPPTNLGSLEVSYTADGQQQLTFRYAPSDPTQPREFQVKPRSKRAMLVFTEKTPAPNAAPSSLSPAASLLSSSSASPSLPPSSSSSPLPPSGSVCKFLAPVTLIADVVPPDTPLYRQFLTRRTASHASQSNTQRMEDRGDLFITPQVQAEIERKRRREDDRKEKGAAGDRDDAPTKGRKDGKRVRGERAEVESLLLRLFSETRWLTLRQLVVGTQQPVNFLKEVMSDMCVRETKGEHKDQYQLNERYRIGE